MGKYQTEQRKKLTNFFESKNHEAVSVQDIYSQLEKEGISMSAIYRNISQMEKDGVICKIAGKNRKDAMYQYINPDCCVGVVHLKCETCQETMHIDKNISQMIFNLAKDNFGFEINKNSPFLYGQCENCLQNDVKL